MLIDTLKLPNVRFSPDIEAKYPTHLYTRALEDHTTFKEVLYSVAMKYPQWSISLNHVSHIGDTYITVSRAVVFYGKEELGVIGLSRRGRDRMTYLSNPRISKEVARSGGRMFTKDPKRATTIVRKYFGPQNHVEAIDSAAPKLTEALSSVTYERRLSMSSAHTRLSNGAIGFLLQHEEGLVQLLGPDLRDQLGEYRCAMASMDEADRLSIDEGVIVVAFDGGYVVRCNDTVSTYTDATLPWNLRGSLGMLKLVDVGVVIGAGIKANDRTFLVVPEGERDVDSV